MKTESRRNVVNVRSESQAAQVQDARKRYERDIDALARKVDQFRVDGQRFFAGDLKIPPEDLRDEIRDGLKRLQGSKLATSADTFRLSSLEARFNSLGELFGRRLRDREQGGEPRHKAERPELRHDPRAGVVLSRAGAVEALYKGLYPAAGGARPTMDLDRFRDHLRKQAAAIREKTGAADIQFRIAEENGKMKIKAKPIKKAAS